MTRRIVAAVLWGYFGWYLAAHVASLFGIPADLAPIGGLLMAAIALIDWGRLTRTRSARDDGRPIPT